MYIEDFKEILERFEKDDLNSEKYLDSVYQVDPSLCEFITNNEYSKINVKQNWFLIHKLFKNHDDLYEWMMWYLYDKSSMVDVIERNGVHYEIRDIDSFMVFVQQEFNLKIRSK